MTTTQARTSPLKLVVALANTTGSATADRCSGKCPVQEVRSSPHPSSQPISNLKTVLMMHCIGTPALVQLQASRTSTVAELLPVS